MIVEFTQLVLDIRHRCSNKSFGFLPARQVLNTESQGYAIQAVDLWQHNA